MYSWVRGAARVARAQSGGRWREGHDDAGQTLQLAEAPAKTFPRPSPAPPLIINLGFVCKQQLVSFVSLPSPSLSPAPFLLPQASQLALPSQALPSPQVI